MLVKEAPSGPGPERQVALDVQRGTQKAVWVQESACA